MLSYAHLWMQFPWEDEFVTKQSLNIPQKNSSTISFVKMAYTNKCYSKKWVINHNLWVMAVIMTCILIIFQELCERWLSSLQFKKCDSKMAHWFDRNGKLWVRYRWCKKKITCIKRLFGFAARWTLCSHRKPDRYLSSRSKKIYA